MAGDSELQGTNIALEYESGFAVVTANRYGIDNVVGPKAPLKNTCNFLLGCVCMCVFG